MDEAPKNLRVCGNGKSLIREGGGRYRTPVLDSGETGNVWHRMSISCGYKRGGCFRVSVYASDNNVLTCNNRICAIEEVLALKDEAEKERILSGTLIKTLENPSDVLLHDTVGRFMWCRFMICGGVEVDFNSIIISTPRQSLLEYLPELYQDTSVNSFADKYLSIFQTIYEDFEYKILHSSALYEPKSAPYEFVERMAEWFCIEDRLLWRGWQLRAVLENIHTLYKKRGTLEALELIIGIFCAGKPYFVETFHAMRYYQSSRHLKRLYSSDRFALWVLLFYPLSDKAVAVLQHIIDQNKPAHVNAHLIVLKPHIILGSYSYLGINSVTSHFQEAKLSGQSMLGYATL